MLCAINILDAAFESKNEIVIAALGPSLLDG
jgi:hypothetical protein